MMLQCLVFALASLIRPGRAQGSTTSSSAVPTYTVSVGAAGFIFTPDMVIANIGDINTDSILKITLSREPTTSPRVYRMNIADLEELDFGVAFTLSMSYPHSLPSFRFRSTIPVQYFFYCSAPEACIDDEMVGVINPNDTQTLEIQKAHAKNATIAFSPSESFPIESASSRSSSAPTSIFSSSSSGTTATNTATATPTSTPTAAAAVSKPALSTGAIAGIAVGGAAVLVLAGAFIYLCGRQRTLGEIVQQNMQDATPTHMPGHFSLASATTYPPNPPTSDVDALGGTRYAAPAEVFDRLTIEMESDRSWSSQIDDGSELVVIPNMNLASSSVNSSPGGSSRDGSPMSRRPIPDRTNSASPLEERIYQPLNAVVPAELRVDMHDGPHELDVESGRNSDPHPHNGPEYNPSPSSEHIQGRHLV
ncbi:hypothetical protein LSUB1_G000420 [Lachnellula subtilissima]|uniref:GPI-anchored cupredoxin n=1 Tax=Lachnellula subtilissima TaxID=602034 RepID=A0A8H8UFD0_9HELO|nr:hypothetical protein LSUB1_G000420 [Lachnellula subtilissima]